MEDDVACDQFVRKYNNKNRLLLGNKKMNSNDSFLTTISEKQRQTDISQPKFITASKWQNHMIEILKVMMKKYNQKKNLITDLQTIVSSIPEEHFVQATLKMRPFKPQFLPTAPIFATVTQSTVAETVAQHVKFSPCKFKQKQQQKKKQRITQKTLSHQFEKDYHPFKFVGKNFKRLMELKFKSLIDSKKLPDLTSIINQVKSDMVIFSEFFHKAAQPYKKLFKCPNSSSQQDQNNKFQEFLDYFISENQRLNRCIHKIFAYACKVLYQQKIDLKIQDYVNPQDFALLPAEFRIDGGYVRTLNSLMQFAQMFSQQKGLRKLIQIRENILVDINEYYLEKKLEKELEVSAEVQIEIIRFCLAKLKGWATEMMASLKFLEYAFGQEQMGYKYEESSYLYTQLCMAFEVLELDN